MTVEVCIAVTRDMDLAPIWGRCLSELHYFVGGKGVGRSPEDSSGLEGRQDASQVCFGIYFAPPTRSHWRRLQRLKLQLLQLRSVVHARNQSSSAPILANLYQRIQVTVRSCIPMSSATVSGCRRKACTFVPEGALQSTMLSGAAVEKVVA